MAAKSSAFDNQLLQLIFLGTTIPNIADNAVTSPATNFYVSLHSADPGAGGDQTTSEIAYTGYARVAVPRGSGWSVSGNTVNPVAAITFPECTGGSGIAAYWSVGMLQTGNGIILYRGRVNPTVATTEGVIPVIATSSTITES